MTKTRGNYFSKRFSLAALLGAFIMFSSAACAQDGWENGDELIEAMQLKKGSWAADVGSREGYFTMQMAPLVGKSGHIFAVDIDADALEDLHKNLKERKLENITPVYSVQDNPMLPPRALDAALIRNAYHEFTEPMGILEHLKKSLKANGRLVIAESVEEDSRNKSRKEQKRSHDIGMDFVRKDLEKAGFKIIKEAEPLTEVRDNEYYWMLVAVPER